MMIYNNLETVLQKIRKSNPEFRITTQRRIILNAVLSMDGHFSADEVINKIEDLYPDLSGISKGTIYGTLDSLAKNNILTMIQGRTFKDESKGGYYARTYYDRRIDPHVNMICVSCGKIEDLNEVSLENVLNEININDSWELVQQTIGLQGVCITCKSK